MAKEKTVKNAVIKKIAFEEEFNQLSIKIRKPVFPRHYQVESVKHLMKAKNGFIKAPTGSGKTNIMAYFLGALKAPTIIVVPTNDLVSQTADRIGSIFNLNEEENYNFIQTSKETRARKFYAMVLVTTWQSLQNFKKRKEIFQAGYTRMVVDEAHKASADQLFQYVAEFKESMEKQNIENFSFFGFTATDYRTRTEQTDRIKETFGKILYEIDIEDLYRDGFILRPAIKIVSIQNSNAGLEVASGKYFEQAIRENTKSMRFVACKKMKENLTSASYNSLPELRNASEFYIMKNFEQYMNYLVYYMNSDQSLLQPQKIGLAKKGLDLNKERNDKIINYLLTEINPIEDRAVILLSSIDAMQRLKETLTSSLRFLQTIFILNSETKDTEEIQSLYTAVKTNKNRNYIIISSAQFLGTGSDIPSLNQVFVYSAAYPPYAPLELSSQITGRAVRQDIHNKNKKPIVHFFVEEKTIGDTKKAELKSLEKVIEAFHPKEIEYKKI